MHDDESEQPPRKSVHFTPAGATVSNGGSAPNAIEVSSKTFSFILDQPFINLSSTTNKNQTDTPELKTLKNLINDANKNWDLFRASANKSDRTAIKKSTKELKDLAEELSAQIDALINAIDPFLDAFKKRLEANSSTVTKSIPVIENIPSLDKTSFIDRIPTLARNITEARLEKFRKQIYRDAELELPTKKITNKPTQ